MKSRLRYYGDPILRERCAPIKEITEEIRALAAEMIKIMYANNGAGLAAPQVGYPLRMFILCDYIHTDTDQWELAPPRVYINPNITNPSDELLDDVEGCLSIPKLRGYVLRPAKIHVEALDLEGNLFSEDVEGYNARVRMHENDHLNGVLFFDRMDPKERKMLDLELRAIKKKYKD